MRYFAFLGSKRGKKPYEGDFKSQVSTTFSKAPPCGLTAPERISIVAFVNLALFQLKCYFLCFETYFFEFGPVFGCHAPPPPKKTNSIFGCSILFQVQRKKNFPKSSKNKKARRPRKFPVATFWLLIGNPYFIIFQIGNPYFIIFHSLYFTFYHHYFDIKYNCYSKSYLLSGLQ